jgi:hypothetical protein
MFDNFHLLRTIPFPAGYSEEENQTNLRIAPSASLLMTPRGHGTNGVRRRELANHGPDAPPALRHEAFTAENRRP